MRDEDHRDAPVPRLQDVLEHDTGLLDAEGRGRLVEDQHAGTEVDRTRDRDRLPLAAGERADRLVRVADRDAHLPQLAADDLLRRRPVQPLERAEALPRLGAEEEVPPDRHQRHHREILVHGRDPLRARVARRLEDDFVPVDAQPAFVGLMGAGEDLDEARLAGAVVAEDARHFAGVHVRRDVVQRDDVSVELRDPVRLEQVRAVVHLALCARWRTSRLSMTAANRIPPWNVYVQLLSHCARMIPSCTMPSIAAPKKVPITEP